MLPDYGAVIFDEAHHLEDVATDSFGIEFSNYRVPHVLNRIKKRRDINIQPGELEFIASVNNQLFDAFGRMGKSEFFFDELYESESKIERGKRRHRPAHNARQPRARSLPARTPWATRSSRTASTATGTWSLECAGSCTASSSASRRTTSGGRRGRRARKFVNCYLHFTPINVAELFKDALWDRTDTIVCTSATLSNSGTFCYIKNRLGAEDTNELILGSPFDFMSQSLLYVPDDLEFPSAKRGLRRLGRRSHPRDTARHQRPRVHAVHFVSDDALRCSTGS